MSSKLSGAQGIVSSPLSFAECWDRQARDRGGEIALVDPRRSLIWHDAADLSGRLASGLSALGVGPGQIIACWLPNCVELYLLRIACERAGFVWLPIAANLREWELEAILTHTAPALLVIRSQIGSMNYLAAARTLLKKLPAAPRLLLLDAPASHGELSVDQVVSRGSRLWAQSLPRVSPEACSVILPTSGSTGLPKFAVFRVSAWFLRGREQAKLVQLTESDLIVSLSQGIGPSIIPLFAAPFTGAAVWLMDRFDPDRVIDALSRLRPTIVCSVPTQLTALVQHPAWPPSGLERMRIWYSTGAALAVATAERLEATTPGVALSGYGGMDFGGWVVPSPADPPAVRHHTVGRPRGETELRLVGDDGEDVPPGEVGEIWGRGPCCASGYFRDEVTTRERWTSDGWFKTGDLARWNAEGNLVIVGRKREIIRRGGRTIVPAEIEGLLSGHPKILKVAVIGTPDPLLGERACAVVVPKPGEPITLDEVTAFLQSRRVASFKLPERLHVLPDLPSKGDKVDRGALRQAILKNDSTRS